MKLNYKQSFIGGAIAFVIATSCCWLPFFVIAIGGATGLLGMTEALEKYSALFMLLGFGFLGIGLFQFRKIKNFKMNKSEVILLSTITCPKCGFQKEEEMPTNACQFFYECTQCSTVLKPKEGDCCVYCSYGTVACPPIQMDEDCCN